MLEFHLEATKDGVHLKALETRDHDGVKVFDWSLLVLDKNDGVILSWGISERTKLPLENGQLRIKGFVPLAEKT